MSALHAKTVALAEGRQLEELAGLLQDEGAAVLRCPLLSILDAPDAGPVLSYVYAPAADDDRVADLIERLAAGAVDALVFTSSPQVDRLYEVAEKRGLTEKLAAALPRVKVAAVGPIVAETLRARGAPVH